MFFSDVLRYPLTDTFNNLRYSYYKKDFTMSKYYVVSGNFKTTIIAKDPKIAAIKAIDSIGDNVDDKDKIFLGLSVVVNETGFKSETRKSVALLINRLKHKQYPNPNIMEVTSKITKLND